MVGVFNVSLPFVGDVLERSARRKEMNQENKFVVPRVFAQSRSSFISSAL